MKALRLLGLLAALVLAFGVQAAEADTLCLSEPVVALTYHARVEVAKNRPAKFSIVWNQGRRADIEARPVSEADGDGRCEFIFAIYEGARLVDEGRGFFKYATGAHPAFSAVLNVDALGADLALGGASPEVHVPVAFDAETPGCIGILPGRQKVVENILISQSSAPRQKSRFESEAALMEYLAKSEDKKEGLWMYLDRNIDTANAMLGGEYRVATVAGGDDCYDIIYLGGDNLFEQSWQPLEVRGRLMSTPFIDHYDLEWQTADGRLLRRDTSAAFEAGGAVLNLNFPLLKSAFRFRRLR